ncbi:hypothetical protein R69746_07694 [Paraburkholderia aspalathi]|nr:hypothetical protein R69746_07694 [Paraburkholderia aspalathi]
MMLHVRTPPVGDRQHAIRMGWSAFGGNQHPTDSCNSRRLQSSCCISGAPDHFCLPALGELLQDISTNDLRVSLGYDALINTTHASAKSGTLRADYRF